MSDKKFKLALCQLRTDFDVDTTMNKTEAMLREAAEHGAQLHITERSMATELLIHAYLDGVFAAWVRAGETRGRQDGKFYRTARRLKNATAVIDMGERSVDTNRWVFDLLSHGYGALCLLLGRSA